MEYHYKPQGPWMTNPILQKRNGQYRYYQNDHLGTPQQLITTSGRVVWEGRYHAFGEVEIVKNETENNLRFPGQYYDAETGTYYNYHRDYDPELGRYLQSDPRGLLLIFDDPVRQLVDEIGAPIPEYYHVGMINQQYGYVSQNPQGSADQAGEVAPLAAMGAGCLIGAAMEAGMQAMQCGKVNDWLGLAVACASGSTFFGRLGYMKTLKDLKPMIRNNKHAYRVRAAVKKAYRPPFLRDSMKRRDRPRRKVENPMDSFDRTNGKYDAGLLGGGAAGIGANAACNECDK